MKKNNALTIVLIVISIICLLFLIKLTQKAVNPIIVSPPPPARVVTEYQRDFLNIEDYVSTSVCDATTKNWKTATITDVLTLKIPNYIRQRKEFNGQNFEVEHPSLGQLNVSTSLAGGFKIQGAEGFTKSLNWLIDSRAAHLNNASFYSSGNMKYVIGDYFFIIGSEQASPQWWAFSVIQQQVNDTGVREFEFTRSNDFKCLIRSVSFN